MPQLWLSLLSFCAVPVELHASLSVHFSVSMSVFRRASRDFCRLQRQVGAQGGAACKRKHRPGPGRVAAARAFLCDPYLNTVRDLEIKGASQFFLFISVLSVALFLQRCRGIRSQKPRALGEWGAKVPVTSATLDSAEESPGKRASLQGPQDLYSYGSRPERS